MCLRRGGCFSLRLHTFSTPDIQQNRISRVHAPLVFFGNIDRINLIDFILLFFLSSFSLSLSLLFFFCVFRQFSKFWSNFLRRRFVLREEEELDLWKKKKKKKGKNESSEEKIIERRNRVISHSLEKQDEVEIVERAVNEDESWAFYEDIKKWKFFFGSDSISNIIFLLFQICEISSSCEQRAISSSMTLNFTVDLKTKIYKKLRGSLERKSSSFLRNYVRVKGNEFIRRERERKKLFVN